MIHSRSHGGLMSEFPVAVDGYRRLTMIGSTEIGLNHAQSRNALDQITDHEFDTSNGQIRPTTPRPYADWDC